jgi:hypothetical protein
VRIVNDLAGEKDGAIGEALTRLIGVVDRPIDAVAEAELAREMNAQPTRFEAVVGVLDLGNEIAVIARFEDVRNFASAIEAFAEDQRLRLQRRRYLTSQARGVTASSARSDAGPVLPTAASICPSSSSSEREAATVRIGAR